MDTNPLVPVGAIGAVPLGLSHKVPVSALATGTVALGLGSVERQRLSVEIFGALDFDQDRKSFLVRIAVFFRLHQTPPDLFVNRAGFVNPGAAVEPGDASLWQDAFLAELRVAEEDGQWRAVRQVLVG